MSLRSARMSFRLDPIHQQSGPHLLGHGFGGRIAVLRLARQRTVNDSAHRRDGRRTA